MDNVLWSYWKNDGTVATQYHFSQKTRCKLEENGFLSYSYQGYHTSNEPVVALLVTQRPIRPIYSNHLEIEIMDVGDIGGLVVGIVPLNYGLEDSCGSLPGWEDNSVGYHADDGGIFLGCQPPSYQKSKCTVGDRMGVGVTLPANGSPPGTIPTFFFTKNGKKVFEREWDALEDGSHHLAVGMVSAGETVFLLDSDMWLLENEEDLMPPQFQNLELSNEEVVPVASRYHFSQKIRCQLEANGLLSYSYKETNNQIASSPVIALLVTQRPIRPIYSNHLEIEIMDMGRLGALAVGIVPLNYGLDDSCGSEPGWEDNSVGYHADDGRIFLGHLHAAFNKSKCTVGDRMGVGVTFPKYCSPPGTQPTFFFTKNGKKVFEREWDALEDGSHHLAVGMASAGETVLLLDSDMWLWENEEDLMAMSDRGPQRREAEEAQDQPSLQARKLTTPQSEPAREVSRTGANTEDSSLPSLPRYWDLSDTSSNDSYQLIPITKTDSFHEYEKIEMQFFETLSRDKFRILSIQRIQNPDLYQVYQFCKQRMERRSATGAVEEKFLFHGTKQEHIEAICHQGFDFRVCGSSTGCLYGRGSYFAKAADYSRNYTDSRQLFVARVLVGHYTKAESFHTRPPPKDSAHPNRGFFDSCVDDVKNPQIYVVFSIEQAYPEYLIDFEKF